MDGMDLWETLAYSLPSPRDEMLINYDPTIDSAAIRIGDYKLIYSRFFLRSYALID